MSLYNIVLEIQDSDPVVIKRSQEALELFSRDLESYFLPPQIDAFRVALASQHSIPSNDIQEFLLYCFRNVDIVQSKAVAQFLWDPSEESPPSSPALSAIDFILQPLENQQIYIPQNQQFFIDVRLAKGEALVWRYQVGCGQEIDFFALCCPALFRSLKPHPNTDTVDEICETKDINGIDATNSSNSPKSYDHKLSLSLDEFIKSGQHRSIDKSQKEPNFPSSNISIVTATYATLSSESWHYIPFMRSFSSPQSSFPCRPPLTGCYQAQTGGGLCRLLWDNTVVSLSGKHLEYCVQKVSEETMQVLFRRNTSSNPAIGCA